MKTHLYLPLLVLAFSLPALAETISTSAIKATVNADGSYKIDATNPAWSFAGQLPGPVNGIASAKGSDAIGSYQEVTFHCATPDQPVDDSIRLYEGRDVALFSQTWPKGSSVAPTPFPDFISMPQGLFTFSHKNNAFSPPKFDLEQNGTPWLLFNDQKAAVILSPASHFVCASMVGDGATRFASGFSDNLKSVPAKFTQQSLLAIGQGINHTWDSWGSALRDLHGKKPIASDADPILKYYGYWTDNGGAYWYNYNAERGYQGTMEDVIASMRGEGIPLRYLQLDSWWYDKTTTRYDGKKEGPKNSKLPLGDWNRYGGTVRYKADPFVFPDGMGAFHDKVELPFITHNRWIDPTSPYHDHYKISGIAAVDPKFWDEIDTYLHDSGVFCYEQDWLVDIINYSPELTSTTTEGDAFLDSMANTAKEHGLSVQYCMATPSCFLEGSQYNNLTSIRVSNDKFIPERYHDFLYTSRLAWSIGTYPWSDVFRSTEMSNLVLDVLSAGPVGTGDEVGKQSKENILKAVRADGVILKPDAPVMPVDSAYVNEAQKKNLPILAATYTDHDGIRTIYGVAVTSSKKPVDPLTVTAEELGVTGPAYLYHGLDGTSAKLAKDGSFTLDVKFGDSGFFSIAPVGASGIAFLGDADKLVGTGKKRIASLQDDGKKLNAVVLASAKESEIKLHGFAAAAPQVSVQGGTADAVQYDAASQHFTVTVKPDTTAAPDTTDVDPTRKMTVSFQAGA